MGWMRRVLNRSTSTLLNACAVVLLVSGALAGWVLPNFPSLLPVPAVSQRLAATHLDASTYLGADITALAVLVAVVIGFNVTVIQIAGQAHSLRMIRGILATLLPFLLTWCLATGEALMLFLIPPLYVSQLWQQLAWFAAVVLLMIAYLWDLPWRLSGDYVALWAIRGLAGNPVETWESIEGYSALQTAVAGAGARGDLGALRALALRLSRFLVTTRDRKAEAADIYNRGRYRALKSLLSGCAQGAADAPSAFAYYLGYIAAGVLLQSIAGGHPVADQDHEIFTGVLRAARGNYEQINPFWTGLRHALCRPADHSTPLLLTYWLERREWPADDPRRVARVATQLARIHSACQEDLRAALDSADQANQAAEMATDLYRDVAVHLGGTVARSRVRSPHMRLPDLPLSLLNDLEARLMRSWPNDPLAASSRTEVANAYERYRAQLGAAVSRAAD